jgi:hypothetical protein
MYYRRPSLFWPIILIGVGVIFLLSNAGVITGNPWPIIANLWPVLLIVIGLDILFGRRSAAGSVISAVLALVVVGGVIALLVVGPNLNLPGFSFGGELKHESVAYPLKEIRSANAQINFSTGRNQLGALGDSSNLIEGDISHYGELEFNVSESGSQADVRVGVRGSVNVIGFQTPERWDVRLNPKISYDLTLGLGAGEATLDLSRFKLTGGRIDVGVGSAELRLPSTGRFSLRVNGGVGSLRIVVPRDMAVSAEVNTGIGSFNPGSRLRALGRDTYETDGFGSAENAITLNVDVGVGSVTILDQ